MAKAKKPRPSFKKTGTGEDTPSATGWVYRSDAAQPAPAARVAEAAPRLPPPDVEDAPPDVARAIPAWERRRNIEPHPWRGQHAHALHLAQRYALYSTGASLVPVPLIDIALIGGVQLKMVQALAHIYDVPFRRDLGKALLGSLLGGVLSTKFGWSIGASLAKGMPGLGALAFDLSVPTLSYAITYGVGRVFIQHFELGGTLLDFNPDAARAELSAALSGSTGS
jgi:uncharacterized protein (DUF697 family)